VKRLFYPAERPLDGRCPECRGLLTHIYVSELLDSALPYREGNVAEVPRWICRRCWGVDDRIPLASESTGNDIVARR
jgi:hypothetical protein